MADRSVHFSLKKKDVKLCKVSRTEPAILTPLVPLTRSM